jgi:hypothetical protein
MAKGPIFIKFQPRSSKLVMLQGIKQLEFHSLGFW